MFLFREASTADEGSILELARHLNTLNLPPDEAFVRELLSRSEASFLGGDHPDAFDPERRFLFVLEGPDGRVVGTSMIHAQHGTPREPHVFFRVDAEERFAELSMAAEQGPEHREVHMVHTMLTLGLTYQGPSEVGGLVLDPQLRGHPGKLGRLLSLGRFVYMATRREWFRDRVLAELLPPLVRGPRGKTRSPLWDSLGSRFTGLTYDEADALSRDDKEFIWRLFPVMPVHASLLPEEVQSIVGQVGDGSMGAKRLLESVGFFYTKRVDPFDGGPHFEANTDDVTLIRDVRPYRPVAAELPEPSAEEGWQPGIIATLASEPSRFRAVWTPMDADPTVGEVDPDHVRLPRPALARLGLCSPDGDDQPNPESKVLVALRPKRSRAERLT